MLKNWKNPFPYFPTSKTLFLTLTGAVFIRLVKNIKPHKIKYL